MKLNVTSKEEINDKLPITNFEFVYFFKGITNFKDNNTHTINTYYPPLKYTNMQIVIRSFIFNCKSDGKQKRVGKFSIKFKQHIKTSKYIYFFPVLLNVY